MNMILGHMTESWNAMKAPLANGVEGKAALYADLAHYHPQAAEFIMLMLIQNPSERPTAATLLQHPFVCPLLPLRHLGSPQLPTTSSLQNVRPFPIVIMQSGHRQSLCYTFMLWNVCFVQRLERQTGPPRLSFQSQFRDTIQLLSLYALACFVCCA